jgi:hypothetical protein
MMKSLLSVALLLSIVSASPDAETQGDPARCRVIRQTLERLRADRQRATDPPQSQQLDQQIRALTTQESSACGASAPVAPSDGGGTPTGPTTTGGDSPSSPLPVDPMDWASDWKHDFGTLQILPGRADQVKSIADRELRVDNALGPKVQCDGRAIYSGTVSWQRPAGGYERPWDGQVIACTNGDFLEGKISNYGSHPAFEPDASASFRIAMTNRENGEFRGSYRVYDTRTGTVKGEPPWSGSGGLTLEVAIRRVMRVLAGGRPVALAPTTGPRNNGVLAKSAPDRRLSSFASVDSRVGRMGGLLSTRDDTCLAPFFGDLRPTTDDEKAMAVIVERSKQNPEALGKALEALLDNDVAHGAYVYVLLGRATPNLISSNLARKLPSNHKVLRYQRARLRNCQEKAKEDLARWMSSVNVAAEIVSAAFDAVLTIHGIPPDLVKLPLSYIKLNQIILEGAGRRDAAFEAELRAATAELMKQAVNIVKAHLDVPGGPTLSDRSTVLTGPIWEYESTGEAVADFRKEFLKTVASAAWKRFTTIDDMALLPDVKARVDAAVTETEWIKLFENERQKQAELALWHRSVLSAFNRIFAAQKWPTDPARYNPAQPLLFGQLLDAFNRYRYNQWVAARAEVINSLEQARKQMILLSYYSGLDEDKTPAP